MPQIISKLARILAQKRKTKTRYASKNIQAYLDSYVNKPEIQQDAQPNLDSYSISYLTMAIESNHSILICGNNTETAEFLRYIINFIPQADTTVIIEKEESKINPQKLLFTENVLYGKRYHNENLKDLILDSLRSFPKWIVLDQLVQNEAGALFSSTDYSCSFISTLNSDNTQNLITKLIQKPFLINTDRLNSLDISIHIEKGHFYIYEYLWLSKAEIDDGFDLFGRDMVKINRIVFTDKSIQNSKVINNFSQMTGLSLTESIDELKRRAKKGK